MYKITPRKIIYNGVATVVFWDDGTKTVVKRAKGTKDDRYNAFCAALAIKMYGSNSGLKKLIKGAENAKKHIINSKYIQVGDRVRVLDGSKIPDYTGDWCMEDYIGRIFTVSKIVDWAGSRKGVKLAEDNGFYTFDIRGLEKV